VILPEEFRQIGFSGLFNAPTTLDAEACAAFRGRVPGLVGGDRWVLASIDEKGGAGVLVRKDAFAITDVLFPPTGSSASGRS
jgi:hypothetical protein